jgi:hypothetical protein
MVPEGDMKSQVVANPFGFTVPCRKAVVSVISVAGNVKTVGPTPLHGLTLTKTGTSVE